LIRRASLTSRPSSLPLTPLAQDNTLTAPYAAEVHPPLRAALEECLAAFSGAACILRHGSWPSARCLPLTRRPL